MAYLPPFPLITSQLAVKIQYPGVAEGIESDINNLVAILNATRLVPDALFLDELVRVSRKELAWEVDYHRERDASNHFRQLLANDPVFYVPEVHNDLSSKRILTTEFLEGTSLCLLLYFFSFWYFNFLLELPRNFFRAVNLFSPSSSLSSILFF